MVSINGINSIANQQQQMQKVNTLSPETQKELQALGVNTQNVKTESQAKEIIQQSKELEQMQAQFKGENSLNVQGMKQTEQVNGTEKNQQTEAFAGGQAGLVQAQPFDMANDIMAQQNRLKLGLI